MNGALVAAALLLAACGSQHTVPPAQTSEPLAETPEPTAHPCDCPADVDVPEPRTPSRTRFAPTEFWCLEYQEAEDKRLNVCYSTENTCNALKKRAIARGLQTTSCQVRATAFCFTMTDRVAQKVSWHCYPSIEECQKTLFEGRTTKPQQEFDRCSTKSHPSPPVADLTAVSGADHKRWP